MTLCRRGRGGFALTAEGEQIYAETIRLLASTESFRASVDAIHRRLGGQLHVALFDKTASNPAAHIGAAIALFCDQAPGRCRSICMWRRSMPSSAASSTGSSRWA